MWNNHEQAATSHFIHEPHRIGVELRSVLRILISLY